MERWTPGGDGRVHDLADTGGVTDLLAHLAVADMSIALSSATVRVGPRRSSPIQCRAATGGNRDLPRERPPSRSSTVYGTACAACHGTDLKGVTGLPDMPSLNREFFRALQGIESDRQGTFPQSRESCSGPRLGDCPAAISGRPQQISTSRSRGTEGSSASLQRRICCEPDFLDQGAEYFMPS